MNQNQVVPGLYTSCGCGGWRDGHPHNPQPHPMAATLGEVMELVYLAKRPLPPLPDEEATVYTLESPDA